MNILDIDLDFFINDIEHNVSDNGKRLNSDAYYPDSKKQVISFLEYNCGLDRSNKILGKVVKHHHEAIYVWDKLLKEGTLKSPFNIIHVDAHPDLGFGDPGIIYIMTELTRNNRMDRSFVQDIDRSKIYCGNYLLFALALGWVRELNFIS